MSHQEERPPTLHRQRSTIKVLNILSSHKEVNSIPVTMMQFIVWQMVKFPKTYHDFQLWHSLKYFNYKLIFL